MSVIDENVLLRDLAEFSFSLKAAEREGDCWPISILASAGTITIEEAVSPTESTKAKVKELRTKGIDYVTASDIDGVQGRVVWRQEPGLHTCATPRAVAAQLAPWKELRHWTTQNSLEVCSSAFQFGTAAVARPTVVFQRGATPGTILLPFKVYALREGDALKRTPVGEPAGT